jgi:AcrR family transcriptional regulator
MPERKVKARRVTKSPAPAAVRRIPQQDRSRARVAVILRTTLRLIGDGQDVSMREIADAAKIPIASIYQYFPDKPALLRAVLGDFYLRMRARMATALTRVQRIEDVPAFTNAMIDELVLEFGASDSHFNVWAASQAHSSLRELDVKEALQLADLVSSRLLEVGKGVDVEAVRDLCVFVVIMAGPVVRQSFILPKREGQRLTRELKALVRLRAESLSAAPR